MFISDTFARSRTIYGSRLIHQQVSTEGLRLTYHLPALLQLIPSPRKGWPNEVIIRPESVEGYFARTPLAVVRRAILTMRTFRSQTIQTF